MIGNPFYDNGKNERHTPPSIIKRANQKLMDMSLSVSKRMSREVPSEDISVLPSQKSISPLPSSSLQSPQGIIQSPLDGIEEIVKNIPSTVDVLLAEEKQIPSLKLKKILPPIWTVEHNSPSNRTIDGRYCDITSKENIGFDKDIREILAAPSDMPEPTKLIIREPMTIIVDDSDSKDSETQTDDVMPPRRKRGRSPGPKNPVRIPIKMPMISPILPSPMANMPPTLPSPQGSPMMSADRIAISKMYIGEIIMNSTVDQPSLYYFKKLAIMTMLDFDTFGDIINKFAAKLSCPRDSVIKSTEEIRHANMCDMPNKKSNPTPHTVPICLSESEDKDGEPNQPK